MLALPFECAGREGFLATKGTGCQCHLSRFFHRDDYEGGREWIATESQQAVICQQDPRDGWVPLKLLYDVSHRFLRATRRPIPYREVFDHTEPQQASLLTYNCLSSTPQP